VLGSDGCGVIQKVGEGVDKELIGKKVAFSGQGWGRYCTRPIQLVMLLEQDQDLLQAANAFINPLTAIGLVQFAFEHHAKSFILTAACGSLSKMIFKLAESKGLKVINICRKDDSCKQLKEDFQQPYVLNSESKTFKKDLEELIKTLQPTVLFDCVGGEIPGQIFGMMPDGSYMTCFGNLSQKQISFMSDDLFFKRKHITGFYMVPWLLELKEEERQKYYTMIAHDLGRKNGEIFGTAVAKKVKLDDWKSSMKESEKEAS